MPGNRNSSQHLTKLLTLDSDLSGTGKQKTHDSYISHADGVPQAQMAILFQLDDKNNMLSFYHFYTFFLFQVLVAEQQTNKEHSLCGYSHAYNCSGSFACVPALPVRLLYLYYIVRILQTDCLAGVLIMSTYE